MIRAVTEKNLKKALDLYYELLALKEPPMRILFLLARQFNLIMQVKELSKCGYDQSQIGKKAGIQPFVVKNYLTYARKYSTEELRAAVEECVAAETKVKNGIYDRYYECGTAFSKIQQYIAKKPWLMTVNQGSDFILILMQECSLL